MYAELIDQKIGQVYQKGVATKILQGMDRIRNEFDETQARRWPCSPASARRIWQRAGCTPPGRSFPTPASRSC